MEKSTVQVFFKIVSSVLNGQTIDTGAFSDWQNLYNIAKGQSAINYLYYAFKENESCPKEIWARIESDNKQIRNQQALQDYYCEEVFGRLENEGIDYAEMKGRTIRALYPNPELRPSCDIDFLYKKDKSIKTKIFAIMEELGGENTSSYLNDDTFTFSPFVTIEAHHSLMATDDFYDKYYKDVWQRLLLKSGKHGYGFSPSDSYIYSLIHDKKHFMLGGCGIKSIIDLYYMRKAYNLDNDEALNQELKALKVYKFNEVAKRLAGVWIEGQAMDDELLAITRYIIEGGTFGSAKNDAIARNVGKDAKTTKRKYYLRKFFPPYRELVKNYKVLKPLPILLPFVWVYRGIKIFLFNNKKFRKDMKAGNVDQKTVEQINAVFNAVNDDE